MADTTLFIGTWKLISWEIRQPCGGIHYPYGKDVVGYPLYTADGYKSAKSMDPDRRQSDPGFLLENATEARLLIGREGVK